LVNGQIGGVTLLLQNWGISSILYAREMLRQIKPELSNNK